MRTSKLWAFAAVLTLVVALVCGAVVWAQTPLRGGGRQRLFGLRAVIALRHAAHQLGLTAQQRQQIRQIAAGRKDEIKSLVDQSVAARRTLRHAIAGGNHDEIASAVTQLSAVELKVADLRADLRAKIFNDVLQPDQRAKANELLSRFDQRADARRQRNDQSLDKF